MDELTAAMARLPIKSDQLSCDGMDNLTADFACLTITSHQVANTHVDEKTAASGGLSHNAQQLPPVSACIENPQILRQVTESTLPETIESTDAQYK
ncbi:hypothetical protein NQZ68_011403 [Dissostichus eleginoides]|nr:hypothetical protein NQZ68_011403 [Dissostichus eleginoides]